MRGILGSSFQITKIFFLQQVSVFFEALLKYWDVLAMELLK